MTSKTGSKIYLLFIALYLLLTCFFFFVCDDAFISFRYSKNLADGHGLFYNPLNSVPIEGYSNFLWVIIGAVIEYLKLPIDLLLPVFSISAGLILIHQVYTLSSLLAEKFKIEDSSFPLQVIALTTLFPPFFIWSSSGLATQVFSLLILTTFRYLFVSPQYRWAILSAVLLSLIRVEGIFWVIFFAGLLLITRPREILRFLSIPLLLYTVYFLWRYNYFGELAPNTVSNKAEFSLAALLRGKDYLLLYLLTFITPCFALFGLLKLVLNRSFWSQLPLICTFSALLAYPVLTGGDFMTMFRFYVPLIPLQMVLVAVSLSMVSYAKLRQVLLILLTVIPLLTVFNFHLIPENFRSKFNLRLNSSQFRSEIDQWQYMKNNSYRWQQLGLALKEMSKPGDSLVAGAIGNVGYFSELHIYDRFGLVNKDVAKLPAKRAGRSPGHEKTVHPTFFLSKQPTYLEAKVTRGIEPEKVKRIIRKWSVYQDYQGSYIDLKKQDLNGKDLGILLLKRKD